MVQVQTSGCGEPKKRSVKWLYIRDNRSRSFFFYNRRNLWSRIRNPFESWLSPMGVKSLNPNSELRT